MTVQPWLQTIAARLQARENRPWLVALAALTALYSWGVRYVNTEEHEKQALIRTKLAQGHVQIRANEHHRSQEFFKIIYSNPYRDEIPQNQLENLVAQGLTHSVRGRQGETPLIAVANLNNVTMVQSLCNQGADVHAHDNHGKTAADYVIERLQELRQQAKTPGNNVILITTEQNKCFTILNLLADHGYQFKYSMAMDSHNMTMHSGGVRYSDASILNDMMGDLQDQCNSFGGRGALNDPISALKIALNRNYQKLIARLDFAPTRLV